MQVEQASRDRIAPICPHFGTCGGCALQHWNSAHYRAWKRDQVIEALRDVGLDAPVDELIDAHGEGRRRAVFHARRGTHDVLEVGFCGLARAPHRARSTAARCSRPRPRRRAPAAWDIAEALGRTRKPLDIQVTATEAGLDVDVRGSGPLTPERTGALAAIAGKPSPGAADATRRTDRAASGTDGHDGPCARVRCRRAPSCRRRPPARRTGAAGRWRIAAGRRSIADLFAGVGPFALRLAERARVMAADSDARGDRGARTAPPRRRKDSSRSSRCVRDLFRRPFVPAELKPFDAVVFDPPRQGAQAQARELAASAVPLIVAVSCNAATFARDARLLVDGGYRLTR